MVEVCNDVEPFVGGYEGSPFHDFVGRVDPEVSWSWPEWTEEST